MILPHAGKPLKKRFPFPVVRICELGSYIFAFCLISSLIFCAKRDIYGNTPSMI